MANLRNHPQLSPQLMKRVKELQSQQQLPQVRPIRELPPVDNRDLDRAYWHGPGADAPRRGGFRPLDDQVFITPVAEEEPDSETPNISFWAVESCPPWNCPPVRSAPFEYDLESCITTYEEWYIIGHVTVPAMHMAVIEQVTYDFTAGLQQYELFEYQIMAQQTPLVTVEDMFIDPLTGDPAHKYAFAGDTRPMPLTDFVDRERILTVRAKVRGFVDLAGVSVHAPGAPILPNAHLRFTVIGYLAPFRNNVDGAPRHQDLGNMGFYDLDDVGYGRDELAWEGY